MSFGDTDARQTSPQTIAAPGKCEYIRPELDDASTQIRLLRLFSRSPMRCELSVHNIEDVAGKYVAISYTWGPVTPSAKIYIQGGKQGSDEHSNSDGIGLSVRSNCLYALGQVRRHYPNELFWIDSICINQDDHGEKQKQVTRMGEIYASASFVVACLGRAGLDRHFFEKSRAYLENVQEEHEACAMMSCMAGRHYFQRLWTVQEFLLARRIEMVCGSRKLDMETLRGNLGVVTRRIDQWARGDAYRAFTSLLQDRGLLSDAQQQSHQALNLAKVILNYSWRDCFDPRDKIYGLLSLCPAPTRDLISVSYGNSLIDILRNYAAMQSKAVVDVSDHATPSALEFAQFAESLKVLSDDFRRQSSPFQKELDKIYSSPCFTTTQSASRQASAMNSLDITITISDSAASCRRISQHEAHNLAVGPCSCDQLIDLDSQLYHSLVTRGRRMYFTNPSHRAGKDDRLSWSFQCLSIPLQSISSESEAGDKVYAKLLVLHNCYSCTPGVFVVPSDTKPDDYLVSFDQPETRHFVFRPSVNGLNTIGEAGCLQAPGYYLPGSRSRISQAAQLSVDELLGAIMRSTEQGLSVLEYVTRLVQQLSMRQTFRFPSLLDEHTLRPSCSYVTRPAGRDPAGFCEWCGLVWWNSQRFWRTPMCTQCRAISKGTSEEMQHLRLRGFLVSDLRREIDKGRRLWSKAAHSLRLRQQQRAQYYSGGPVLEHREPSDRSRATSPALWPQSYYLPSALRDRSLADSPPTLAYRQDGDGLPSVYLLSDMTHELYRPSYRTDVPTYTMPSTAPLWRRLRSLFLEEADPRSYFFRYQVEDFLAQQAKFIENLCHTTTLNHDELPSFIYLIKIVNRLDKSLRAYCWAADDARRLAGCEEHRGVWRWVRGADNDTYIRF